MAKKDRPRPEAKAEEQKRDPLAVCVKLTVARGGPGGSYRPGEIITVCPDEAKRMIKAGQAVPVVNKPETATANEAETR